MPQVMDWDLLEALARTARMHVLKEFRGSISTVTPPEEPILDFLIFPFTGNTPRAERPLMVDDSARYCFAEHESVRQVLHQIAR